MANVDLDRLQRDSLRFLLRTAHADTGLVADSTRPDAPASIAATGLTLAALPVSVERALVSRREAIDRALGTLRFLCEAPQGEEPDATGFRGFFYHFLDPSTGRRAWDCELSMMDTAILLAGGLSCGAYFDGRGDEREIRELATTLVERVDWAWARDGRDVLCMGWSPGSGFLQYFWEGYSEALLLYALALGSPADPLPAESWRAYTRAYQWENVLGVDVLQAGPLFVHQLPQVWLDLRGLRDAFMREKGSDYFENSRRAVEVQRRYAERNPRWCVGYGDRCWGITACDGPGFARQPAEGAVERSFYGYVARGVPFGPDDGTLAPWAVAASLPFAPDAVLATLEDMLRTWPEVLSPDGLLTTFNPTFRGEDGRRGWLCPAHVGLDQGPVGLMIENHRTGLPWKLMRGCPVLASGLRRAGFRGGWIR